MHEEAGDEKSLDRGHEKSDADGQMNRQFQPEGKPDRDPGKNEQSEEHGQVGPYLFAYVLGTVVMIVVRGLLRVCMRRCRRVDLRRKRPGVMRGRVLRLLDITVSVRVHLASSIPLYKR